MASNTIKQDSGSIFIKVISYICISVFALFCVFPLR